MPVEFVSDVQVSAYGCYSRPVSRAELDRYFLDAFLPMIPQPTTAAWVRQALGQGTRRNTRHSNTGPYQ